VIIRVRQAIGMEWREAWVSHSVSQAVPALLRVLNDNGLLQVESGRPLPLRMYKSAGTACETE